VGQGLSAVVRTAHHVLVFDTGPRFASGFNTGSAVLVPYLRTLGVGRVDRLLLSHGDLDHVVHFEVLSPGPLPGSEGNDASCVLRIATGNQALLLTGDIEAGVEQALVEYDAAALRSSVVVAAHHGSRSSSSAAFVKAVSSGLLAVADGHPGNSRFSNGAADPGCLQYHCRVMKQRTISGV